MTHILGAMMIMALGAVAPETGSSVAADQAGEIAKQSGKQSDTQSNVDVDQIIPYDLSERPKSAEPDQIDTIRDKSGTNSTVSQLPDDIEVVDPQGKGPEQAIVRTVDSPEARLYSQVAEVWETIRSRGQQPTPELIAREIGPDALASFLDQNPGAENIFGQDSDNLPLPGAGDLELPDGSGAIILPPASGGG